MTTNLVSKERLTIYLGAYTGLMLIVYCMVYFIEPFSAFVNLLFLNGLTVLAALACALLILRVVLFYEPGEPPRRVWVPFAIALWMWAVAELVWAVYNMLWGEVPNFSFADILWVGSYIFFTVALSRQFRLLQFNRSQRPAWVAVIVWVFALGLSSSITFWTGDSLDTAVQYFYPIADFFVGIAALFLVFFFRRGLLARPWLSLFAFVVSDSLYVWATTSGAYEWITRTGWVTLLVDVIYLLAYVFVTWGVFSQYLTLRFGAIAVPQFSQAIPEKPKSMF
jgi:hypothetical protein